MIKKLSYLSFLLLPIIGKAQDKVYYTPEWIPCTQEKAYYYREITENNKGYYFTDYYMNGDKLRSGNLTELKAEYWKYRNGHFTYYYPDGYKAEEGDYENGNKKGSWYIYTPHTDRKFSEAIWENDKKIKCYQYDNEGKKIVEVETYLDNQKQSKTEYYNNDTVTTLYYYDANNLVKTEESSSINKTVSTKIWKKGKIASETKTKNKTIIYKREEKLVTQYYDNGRIWKKGKVESKSTNFYECYGIDGKDTICENNETDKINRNENKFVFVEQMPTPGFNMIEYLMNNMHYPEYARLKNIEGRVLVKFIVFEDGSIGDVTISKSVHPTLDEEAYRVICKMPNWQPGVQNGEKVKVYYMQPITFKFQ